MIICHIDRLLRNSISSTVDQILNQIAYCSCPYENSSECIIYNIKLALWEVFTNFLCHGSDSSCSDIRVAIDESDSEILIQVTSIGNEFEWEDYLDNECPNVHEVRGRGLYILQQICHHFSYEQNGQVAKMIFKK
ncbi:ATP-binding protein [Robertmurraya andreesenii]|uniref:Anti-sigma regulatory factor (Ser/Thr protein kinase) n=1 Tax=Anoxybacillus andreesenii TaxID=1325932 RepID=A0ABT9V3Y5_9BACL|nr:ATP-binding protein [Robertmurraya andreesenii]MDQ0155663.1 anti-sigma regulatory factor (Ser/Thr protein kinase) [Robertmurraya andreesenii]